MPGGLATLAMLALAIAPSGVAAADKTANCRGFISIPGEVLDAPGTWCLQQDLVVNGRGTDVIRVTANDVTIDCNGLRIEGAAQGATSTRAIFGQASVRTTIRRCDIRGFATAIRLNTTVRDNPHRVENNNVHGAQLGIHVAGDGAVVQGNRITATATSNSLVPIAISTQFNVDVLDNLISGVQTHPASAANAVGIETLGNQGGSIRGNRVLGVSSPGTGEAIAIRNTTSSRVIVRGNTLVNDWTPETIAVQCAGPTDRVKGNTIKGFDVTVVGCSDDGNLVKQF